MKQHFRQILLHFMQKRIDETVLDTYEIKIKREDISFFGLSTNTIISFWYEGSLWYFRECPQIVNSEEYWHKVVSMFFDSLDRLYINKEHFSQEVPICIDFTQKQIVTFQRYLNCKWGEKSFHKMMENADRLAVSGHFSIWENQVYDTAFFDYFTMKDLPEDCRDVAIYFLWILRAAAANYRTMSIVRGKQHSFFGASKIMASQVVADELGLSDLITQSKWCRITVEDDNITWFGTLSASAPGHRMKDATIEPNALLQKPLLDLNLLNVICNQVDHGPNNYNVYTDASGRINVCAFDNDNAQTFFPWMKVSRVLSGCSPFVVEGRIQRPYLARSTVDKLNKVDINRLEERLKPYLNRLQIAAVLRRIYLVQKAVKRTQREKTLFMLEDTQWCEETVKEELSGQYGKTYLSLLCM